MEWIHSITSCGSMSTQFSFLRFWANRSWTQTGEKEHKKSDAAHACVVINLKGTPPPSSASLPCNLHVCLCVTCAWGVTGLTKASDEESKLLCTHVGNCNSNFNVLKCGFPKHPLPSMRADMRTHSLKALSLPTKRNGLLSRGWIS